jgi:hypothetical protein
MSIENSLASIAKSLEIIANQMTKVTTVPAEHAPVTVPVTPTPAPVVAPTPAPTPTPEPVATVTVSDVNAPFSDSKGMIQYVMDAYKALGATKGAKIQEVLQTLGHRNINEVRPDQYAALYAGIEGLK